MKGADEEISRKWKIGLKKNPKCQFGTFEKLLDENASKKIEDERKRKNFHCLMMSRISNIGGSPEVPEAFSLCSDIFLKSLLVLLKIGIAAQSMNTYIILSNSGEVVSADPTLYHQLFSILVFLYSYLYMGISDNVFFFTLISFNFLITFSSSIFSFSNSSRRSSAVDSPRKLTSGSSE